MKKVILTFALFPFFIMAQKVNSDRLKIQHLLDSLSIKLNQPETPTGFKQYADCNSVLFFKKTSSDTILFLTPSSMTPMTYESQFEYSSFLQYISHRESYPLSFPTKFSDDGRIEVVYYGETVFIFRHDSLFIQEEDDDKFVDELVKNLDKLVEGKIDSLTMETNLSKARRKYKPFLFTCFVFNKNMFKKSNKIKISKSLNFTDATVTLEKSWKINNVNCYTILLEGNYGKTPTEVRYTFDDNMKFLNWEGCNE